ncbi:MAG TPA: hypothetical protein VH418_17955, partial [Solirubrobacteraceae bacterium]
MARRWTASDDAQLARLYRGGVAVVDIAARLGRSTDSVNARRRDLGIAARRAQAAWSEREDAVLAAASRAGVPAWVVADRIGRPVGQIRWRRRALGLSGAPARAYSEADDAALCAAYTGGADLQELAARLGRSTGALRLRATKLGMHPVQPRARWSIGEDAAVRDGYDSGLSCREIARELPGRTPAAVAARAGKLGLATHGRRWTADDDERLRGLAARHALDELSRGLGRTPDAVRQRAGKLGLALREDRRLPRGAARWTADEDDLLRLHAGLNPAVLGGLLGRSDRAVTIRLSKLGLRAGRERSPHHAVPRRGDLTPGERALIARELQPGNPRRLFILAGRLGLPSTTLVARVPGGRLNPDPGPQAAAG